MSILSSTLADYTNLLSQTWGDRWKGRVSSIVDQSPLLRLCFLKGAVQMKSGPYITRPFTHAKNPNIQHYSGTQTLNSATFQHTKMLRWEQWGQTSCQCVVPIDDVDKNHQAEGAVEDLIETEEYICSETMAQFIEEDLHTASASSDDIEGLRSQLEFAAPAAQTATVGGIAKSVGLGWYNQFQSVGGSFATQGVKAMRKLYRKCSRYGNDVDCILADESLYDGYEEYLGPLQRLEDKKTAGVGFNHIMFKGAVLIPDYNITADSGEAFFLRITGRNPSDGFNFDPGFLDPIKGMSKGKVNQGNMRLVFNKNAFFKSSDWREAEDQHVIKNKTRVSVILSMDNLREMGTLNFAAGSYQP